MNSISKTFKNKILFLTLLTLSTSNTMKAQDDHRLLLKSDKSEKIGHSDEKDIIKSPTELLPTSKNISPNWPTVGQQMPNFTLKNVYYYKKDNVTLEDFKGKWLILDFWTSTCVACFKSFPKLNMLQEEFKDKVQFLLVGDNEHRYGKNVKEVFERLKRNLDLDLVVAYDSTLFERWKINSVPFTIIIDTKGVVRVVNAIRELNSENLKLLVEKNDPSAFKFVEWVKWDMNKPYLIDGNGGPDDDFEFRSVLTTHKRPTKIMVPISITAYNAGKARIRKGIQGSGMSMSFMYNLAYFDQHVWFYGDSMYGRYAKNPIFEGIDSSLFAVNLKTVENQNLFNYSLSVPNDKASTKFIMEVMQRDLETYFGFTAHVTSKQMPYWKLVASKQTQEKLKTKGVKKKSAIPGSQIILGDQPITALLMNFEAYHQNEPPFIDETGIKENIDIEFNALLTNMKDIHRELSRHGLKLEKSFKEMKVIIVNKKP